jgi:methionyl-tRNA formyltransferase
MIFNKKSEPRIVYMGTPEISAPILEALIQDGYNVVALITNEDKAVGRKKILEPTPTKVVALKIWDPGLSASPDSARLSVAFFP